MCFSKFVFVSVLKNWTTPIEAKGETVNMAYTFLDMPNKIAILPSKWKWVNKTWCKQVEQWRSMVSMVILLWFIKPFLLQGYNSMTMFKNTYCVSKIFFRHANLSFPFTLLVINVIFLIFHNCSNSIIIIIIKITIIITTMTITSIIRIISISRYYVI